MDFFDRQEQARQRTRLLLFLFAVAVLAVFAVNYLVLATFLQPFFKLLPHARRHMPFVYSVFWLLGEALANPLTFLKWLWDARLAACIAVGTLISVALGCWYKMRVLAAGGSAVAELLNGRRIEAGTTEPDERRLRNVIEEMAIASGTPIPEVYVLDNERGINAFAAGHTRQDVAIAVTRGALKLLTRDELQGIIAHEFSHVLHGDTRLNLQLMALAHGLFWPTYLGRLLLRGSTEVPQSDESMFDDGVASRILPTAPIGVIFIVLGCTSLPFVRLLKSAICREREWLADASAVQFTRHPDGIIGTFKKIGGLYKQGRLDVPMAEVASHLYFVNCATDGWLSFLATHPPLVKRILALEPEFDGKFTHTKSLAPNSFERERQFDKIAEGILITQRLTSDALTANAGTLAVSQLQQAAAIRLGLPPAVKNELLKPAGAAAIIYCLLLSNDEAVRDQQIELLQKNLDAAAFRQTTLLSADVADLEEHAKLPLAELAVSTLRQASAGEASKFCAIMQELIECDGAIELFEYTLMKMVQRRLKGSPAPASRSVTRLRDALGECALLLSAVAHVGQETEAQAQSAFAEGLQFLDAPGARPAFVPRSDWDLAKVDAALDRLSRCPPSDRRNLLVACGKTVVADGRVGIREAELLRAIADSLDCPMPPVCGSSSHRGTDARAIVRSGRLARDTIYLDLDAVPKHRLHGGARRQHGAILEKRAIDAVVAVEILHVAEMHGAFDDVVGRAAGSLENLFQLAQCVLGFLFDGSAHGFGGLWINRPLPAHVNPTVNLHGG